MTDPNRAAADYAQGAGRHAGVLLRVARTLMVIATVTSVGCEADSVTGGPLQTSPEDVQVLAKTTAFQRGLPARFTVKNNTSGPVGMSVCGDQLQRRLFNTWLAVAGDVDCDLVRLQIPALSAAEASYPLHNRLPAGVYRVRFTVQQVSSMNGQFEDEYSTAFRVFEAPEAVTQ